MSLDRCTNQRKNKRWLNVEFSRINTLFCVINEGMSLFEQSDKLTPIYLKKNQLAALTVDSCIFIGKENLPIAEEENTLERQPVAIFAVDYNKLRFSTQEDLSNIGQWQALRQATANLMAIDASILALAKALIHWHSSNQYCGLCGNTNRSIEAGHARKCTECRNLTFPRTDPAVIMLVERRFSDGVARCLLGRQGSWPLGMYSTLAGFVDPGESLEQAVIREVQEESAIHVETPKYVASQPWPFPASIMLGFTAVATSENIDTSQDSLEHAKWFSREELKHFSVNNSVLNTEKPTIECSRQVEIDKGVQYKMSSKDSISSYLITAWLNKEIGQY
jgi:NAD+ diphosphatase